MTHAEIHRLGEILPTQTQLRGEHPAVEFASRRLTYAELHARANRAARALVSLGVKPGDRVAWLSRNTDAFLEVFFGAAAVRACLAPINARLAPAEIVVIVEDSQADVLIIGPEFHALAPTLRAGVSRPLVVLSLADPDADLPDGVQSYATLRDAHPATALPAAADPDDDVLQLYTSGTTGLPKGVRLTEGNFSQLLKVAADVEGFDYQPGDVVLIAMPLFHVAGTNISFVGLARGCKLIIVADFAPSSILALIERERVSRMFLAPAMIQMLLQAPEIAAADLSSMKSIAYGASPISEAVLTEAKARFGCGFIQFYGMTESAGGGTLLTPDNHRGELLRSCGAPWPGLDVKICGAGGPGGEPAGPGVVGEIAIRGPMVMKGYWNRPDATAQTIRDGWLLTGDAGYRDAEGFFFVHDRVKDMIVTGGENVYPAEVENAIQGCPGVADVAVIGVPSERWGEEVKALIVAAPDARPEPAAILAWARDRIAAYKAPKSVDFVDALPRNASGKILRRELRAPYWAGRERMVS